jgi:hypothetical protein
MAAKRTATAARNCCLAIGLLLALGLGAGCARNCRLPEADLATRMKRHEAGLRHDRVDYEVELQEARCNQGEHASWR